VRHASVTGGSVLEQRQLKCVRVPDGRGNLLGLGRDSPTGADCCPVACQVTPYTLHPTTYTLHPTPYTLHSTPYTLHPAPYTLHPIPFTLHPTSYTVARQVTLLLTCQDAPHLFVCGS